MFNTSKILRRNGSKLSIASNLLDSNVLEGKGELVRLHQATACFWIRPNFFFFLLLLALGMQSANSQGTRCFCLGKTHPHYGARGLMFHYASLRIEMCLSDTLITIREAKYDSGLGKTITTYKGTGGFLYNVFYASGIKTSNLNDSLKPFSLMQTYHMSNDSLFMNWFVGGNKSDNLPLILEACSPDSLRRDK